MSIDWQRDTQIDVTKAEKERIRDEFDTVQVRKRNGRNKKLHFHDCPYIEKNDVKTITKDMACYPPGWADFCVICVAHYRETHESLDN